MEKTIEIPEGYEARIEGNKVILEPKESKDERIRNGLLRHFKNKTKPYWNEIAVKFIIAYLEKQKEQKPESCDCSRDEESYTNGIHHVLMNPEAYGLIKQKPAEWSEEYRKEDLRTRFAFYTYKDEDSVLYLSNVFVEETSRNKGFGTKILQAAEMVAQTIGALTIRLKVKQNTPANDWYRRHGYGYLVFEDDYDWLEKNLEYLKPKQEQPEEMDEDFFFDEVLKVYDDNDKYPPRSEEELTMLEIIARHFYKLGLNARKEE